MKTFSMHTSAFIERRELRQRILFYQILLLLLRYLNAFKNILDLEFATPTIKANLHLFAWHLQLFYMPHTYFNVCIIQNLRYL